MRNLSALVSLFVSSLLPLAALAQAPSREELRWAAENPDAVRELGNLPADQREKLLETYEGLSEDERRQLRDNADEIRAMSDEEKAWALENPGAARDLGRMNPDDRQRALDAYRNLPPDMQDRVRQGFGSR